MIAPNTGELVDALEAGRIDVSFMPVDDERRKRIDFGPVYFEVESTYMVTQASGINTVNEVDRPGVRVVGIAGTTTIRASGRTLKNTTVKAAQSIGEAIEMMTTRQSRRLRAVARLAAAVRGTAPRLAHRRGRLPVHRRRHRRGEGPTGGAGLCHGVPGQGEAVGCDKARIRARGVGAPGCGVVIPLGSSLCPLPLWDDKIG